MCPSYHSTRATRRSAGSTAACSFVLSLRPRPSSWRRMLFWLGKRQDIVFGHERPSYFCFCFCVCFFCFPTRISHIQCFVSFPTRIPHILVAPDHDAAAELPSSSKRRRCAVKLREGCRTSGNFQHIILLVHYFFHFFDLL